MTELLATSNTSHDFMTFERKQRKYVENILKIFVILLKFGRNTAFGRKCKTLYFLID